MSKSTDHEHTASARQAQPVALAVQRALRASLEGNAAPLLGAIRIYVRRLGLAQGDEVGPVALDVLQDVALEALAHAERFTPSRAPQAWLLGIAVNVIRRKKVDRARRARREVPIQQVFPVFEEAEAERASETGHGSDTRDGSAAQVATGSEIALEAHEQAEGLLALIPAEEREVLRLAILEDFDGDELAERLGVTPGAARMRLHRALGRLRAACRDRQLIPEGKGEQRDA